MALDQLIGAEKTQPVTVSGNDLGPVLKYNNPNMPTLPPNTYFPPKAISGPGTITDPKLFPELFPPNFLNQVDPLQTVEPNYSSQFENFGKTLGGFGEQLGGFGEQMTGYQDALGSFNEQIGGFGKQFETLNNKIDQGLGSLGNQIASLENMQKAQPQQVMQPQQQSYSPFNSPFGFGGLGSLFGGYF